MTQLDPSALPLGLVRSTVLLSGQVWSANRLGSPVLPNALPAPVTRVEWVAILIEGLGNMSEQQIVRPKREHEPKLVDGAAEVPHLLRRHRKRRLPEQT